jgi:hypothetical protein
MLLNNVLGCEKNYDRKRGVMVSCRENIAFGFLVPSIILPTEAIGGHQFFMMMLIVKPIFSS